MPGYGLGAAAFQIHTLHLPLQGFHLYTSTQPSSSDGTPHGSNSNEFLCNEMLVGTWEIQARKQTRGCILCENDVNFTLSFRFLSFWKM